MSSCTIKQCLIESDPADPPHERGQTVISIDTATLDIVEP